MSVLPVIVREMRAQARQPLTYWLRIIAALLVSGAIGYALWRMGHDYRPSSRWFPGPVQNPIQAFGATLFGKLNLFIFLAIWVFVPLATADAVSRERREGTLVLLYLTDLRSLGIVVGKTFVHMLRAASLFLTMAPWLFLPLIFGGVERRDIAMAMLLDMAALILAQAAGLLASTFPRDWLKAVILAEVFALVLFVGLLRAHERALGAMVRASLPSQVAVGTAAFWNSKVAGFWWLYQRSSGDGFIAQTSRLLQFTTNSSFDLSDDRYGSGLETHWGEVWTGLPAAAHRCWFGGVLRIVAGSALVLLAVTAIGAWRVQRSWRDAPADPAVADIRRKLLLPRYGVRSLRRTLSRSLDVNPIGWLQLYSPSARLVKWAWCLFIIVVEVALSNNSADLYQAQTWLGWLLLLGLTFSATGSFRQELEAGAFELLLVTPLRERQIILGRLRGLWRQFLPALLIYAAARIYLTNGWTTAPYASTTWPGLIRTAEGFVCLPMIGLYFSMRRWNFFAAWLAAFVVGMAPASVGYALGAGNTSMMLLQLAVAVAAGVLLERQLRHRRFVRR